ncbi:unnamed protein product [Heterobilharzia americana]|nr:unnamed protein product [Heterobilharzia americana]
MDFRKRIIDNEHNWDRKGTEDEDVFWRKLTKNISGSNSKHLKNNILLNPSCKNNSVMKCFQESNDFGNGSTLQDKLSIFLNVSDLLLQTHSQSMVFAQKRITPEMCLSDTYRIFKRIDKPNNKVLHGTVYRSQLPYSQIQKRNSALKLTKRRNLAG